MLNLFSKKPYLEKTGIENTEGLVSFEDPSGLKLRVRPTHVALNCSTTDEYGYDENNKFGIVEKAESFVHQQPAYEISIDLNGTDPQAVIAKLNAVPRGGFINLPEQYILANHTILPLSIVENHPILANQLFDKIYASGLFEKDTIQKVANVVSGATTQTKAEPDAGNEVDKLSDGETNISASNSSASTEAATPSNTTSADGRAVDASKHSPKSQQGQSPFSK